jgi:hypothetical protein
VWEKIEISAELENTDPIILYYLNDFGMKPVTVTLGSMPIEAVAVARISTGDKYISTMEDASKWLITKGCSVTDLEFLVQASANG